MTSATLAVAGATGRLGSAICRAAQASDDLTLAAALTETSLETSLKASLKTSLTSAFLGVDVVIECVGGAACADYVEACARARVPCVLASTGMTAADNARIDAASKRVAVLRAPNASQGFAALVALALQAQTRLAGWDCAISETHHRNKRDAPSGAAKALRAALGGTPPTTSMRLGSVVGTHEVVFAGDGERIILTHVAEDRAIFAKGALLAARWLVGKPAGLYTMAHATP